MEINKELFKDHDEQVAELEKQSDDHDKEVQKEIEEKEDQVEDINDAKADQVEKSKEVSKKEFDKMQERKDVKQFTEKLELNEAAETQTEIKELLSDYLLQELEESEFMDNLAWRAENEVPGYNHDWCAEEASRDYKEKEYEFINELVEDLMAMCPLEESLKENKLNESDEEDLKKDANSLSDYLSKNKLYCDLEDYELYPLGVKVVTFRVEGDWKHDHWYFEDLVRDWAKENGKEIFKMDSHTVEEDGSDYYTADHKVYITDKETSDRLNSMRGLFAPKEESLKESKKLNERISAQSSTLAFIKDAFDIDENDIKNELRDQFGCKQSFVDYDNSSMRITAYTDKKNAEKLRGFALSRGADVKLQLSHNANQKNAALNEDLYEVTINFPMAHVALYAMSVCEESGLDFRDIQKTYDALVRFFYDLKTPVMDMDESLKEDLMSNSWGSDFRSDVYNALSKIAFKYYRKDINVTDGDWGEAIEWFMTHFFESDDNPFDESLKEGHYGQITLDVAKKMDKGDYMAIYKWPSGRNSFGLAAYIYAIYESIKNDLGADRCNPYYAQNSSMFIDYLIDNYSKESVNKAVEEFKKYGVELKPTVKSPWNDKKGVSQYFRITNVDENKLLNSTLNNYSVIKSKEEVDKYLNQYFKDLPAIKAAEDAEWVAKQAQSSADETKEESLKESAEKFIITKVGNDKYALAKGNPPVVNARIIITAKSPEEAKQILVNNGYSEDELVIESLKEALYDVSETNKIITQIFEEFGWTLHYIENWYRSAVGIGSRPEGKIIKPKEKKEIRTKYLKRFNELYHGDYITKCSCIGTYNFNDEFYIPIDFRIDDSKSEKDEPLKEDVELWDSDRVVDLARYYNKKYPYAEDEKIIKAIIKTMQKQGSTLPSDLKEVEKIYYDTINEDNDYDAEYGEPYDESLDESKLDEAIPREVAQALKNSNNQEIKNSGGAKYKIPGMSKYRTSDVASKDALNKSNVDYEKAEFNKISKEEALNVYKTEPQNLLLIVSDDHGYGNVEQKAIWFEASGDRFGRAENVPDEKAPRRRDGSLITDTKYMTIKQLIDCADSCYWTNQRDVTRDPVLQDIRSKNPESRNYTGLNAKDIEQEYSPKNSGRYYVDNNVSRGVSPEYGWNSWTAVRQRRYDNLKARIEELEAELASGNLDRSEKINELERLQGLKSELSQLEDTRAKAIGAEKDYNARRRYLTAEQAQRSTMKKFIDLKNAVENAYWDLKNAQRNLDDVRKQGGTWSNDYDRRKVSNYTDQIRRLQAQIADYQRMIDELNTKLSSQQVSEEDAKAIADAEAKFAEVQNRVQSQKDELNSILDRARARRQNTESLEEDLKVTINFDSFEPYGQAVDTYNRIKDANKLDEADAILEELYPDGIDEASLNDILAYSPEWLLNELGLADDEEKEMLDIK